MADNKNLHNANRAKQDEFYTQLIDIEKELKHYKDFFKDKVVLCNCDDPFESNFFKYFALNFNYLGLKKLIYTSYAGSPIAHTELNDLPLFHKDEKLPYMIEITEVKDENGDGATDLSDIRFLLENDKNTLTLLDGDGDFRSEECIGFLEEADVVVTNPPFSLFREYVAQLIKYNKKFLIIGNQNAITYKEIFPLIKDNKLWLGHSIHSGDREFRIPDYYEVRSKSLRIDEKGNKYIRVVGVRWYTNIDYEARHEKLILYKHYTPEEYPKYDNYDAINVNKTSDIPCDYFEDVGVPITYLDKHNPEQFDIVKFRKGNDGKDLTYTRERESYAILQNHHQKKGITALWESQSHLSTSGIQPNSKLSEQQNLKEKVFLKDSGTKEAELPNHLSTENEYTNESLSRKRRNGIMGVPITFLDKYNPDQFEIINGIGRYACIEADYTNPPGTYGTDINGKHTYFRILIKRRTK